MFLQDPLLLLLSSVLVVSTTPSPPARARASKISATLDTTTSLNPSNESFSKLDTIAENSLTIHCDGRTYGYNPSIPDCESTSRYLTPDDRIWTFKQRSMDFPPDTAYLPYLLMGDRALCYIEAVLVGDNLTARASKTMLRNAAAALVMQCAQGATSQGGIATNIGGDNHLAVVLGTYDRQPTCNDESAPGESCRHILYTMPADKTAETFGPERRPFDPGPEPSVFTPFHMPSGDGGCSAIIITPGRAYDVALFYDVFVAVNAIFAVCSRRDNKGGLMRGLGNHGRIYVAMSGERRLELPSNTSVIVTS